MNGHWHHFKAKVRNGTIRRRALADLRRLVPKYGVRFVAGDYNMSRDALVDDLRAGGIEATLVAFHCELGEIRETLDGPAPSSRMVKDTSWRMDVLPTVHWDSCLIMAIGGLRYAPKPLTPTAHIFMGAQHPSRACGTSQRGFPSPSYIRESVSPEV